MQTNYFQIDLGTLLRLHATQNVIQKFMSGIQLATHAPLVAGAILEKSKEALEHASNEASKKDMYRRKFLRYKRLCLEQTTEIARLETKTKDLTEDVQVMQGMTFLLYIVWRINLVKIFYGNTYKVTTLTLILLT